MAIAVDDILEFLFSLFYQAGRQVETVGKFLWEKIRTCFRRLKNYLKQLLKDIWEKIKSMLTTVSDKVVEAYESLKTVVTEIVKMVANFIERFNSKFSKKINNTKDEYRMLRKRITSKAEEIKDKLMSVMAYLKYINNILGIDKLMKEEDMDIIHGFFIFFQILSETPSVVILVIWEIFTSYSVKGLPGKNKRSAYLKQLDEKTQKMASFLIFLAERVFGF
ncbi:hypothetical protein AQUCO_01900001v1 [Aquilegia coerulea]|uniref:Uncharacterized protein n=1 Tax=Aquilegia coerulea TaxID=218851 RepID=A0A2G5DJB2_AQUCA|nr:hypothetical protein AQUCO_01900001v1 [Aquilegia coerulea]